MSQCRLGLIGRSSWSWVGLRGYETHWSPYLLTRQLALVHIRFVDRLSLLKGFLLSTPIIWFVNLDCCSFIQFVVSFTRQIKSVESSKVQFRSRT